MAKYIIKLTHNKGRHTITIPVDLVRKRGLAKYDYMIIKASNGKPITMRGVDINNVKE